MCTQNKLRCVTETRNIEENLYGKISLIGLRDLRIKLGKFYLGKSVGSQKEIS